jgi:hypothetical protein
VEVAIPLLILIGSELDVEFLNTMLPVTASKLLEESSKSLA